MAQKTAYVFIADRDTTVEQLKHKLGTTEAQLEIFLLKYPDMDRDSLKYIIDNLFEPDDILSHELNETEIKSVADDIGATLIDTDITSFLSKLPANQHGKTFFTEIACFIFSKPFIRDMSDLKDTEAVAKTNAAASKAKAIQDQIVSEKEAEVKAKEDAKKMEEKIQSGLQKTGVAGRAAMFEKNIHANKNDPKAAADKVRHENALKKQQKEAEKALITAQEEEAIKQKAMEVAAAEAIKTAKVNKLAEQMNKFGIRDSRE